MKYFFFILTLFTFTSCFKGKKVDLIIHNAQIHVMDDQMNKAEAIAILDGKIVEVGPERQILNKYRAKTVIDAKSKDIFPGFHDCHGHLFSLARQKLYANLYKSRSYYEMISILEKHQAKEDQKIIVGRGWDHSLWGDKEMPDNQLLNEAFPTIPVALTRIDGHAMLVNQALLDFIGITAETQVDGGEILMKNGKLTGILLDHALDLVNEKLPTPDKEVLKEKLMIIQEELLATGITHVHEAGITAEEREILIELADAGELKINVYAMLLPSEENFLFAENEGFYTNNHLSIRSFKVIADGALGSHGACLLEAYSDMPNVFGMLLKNKEELQTIFARAKEVNYQVNTHCIGDSANRTVLRIIDTLMQDQPDHRWRIEHAQILHPNDFDLFLSSGVIPSVQPTHATSDQRWAEHHIGKARLENGAYAYKTLIDKVGMVLFGTDFPIEDFDPFATIYAAVQRKSIDGEPAGGFLPHEAVELETALKAMTLWASFGCFEENTVGTLEANKRANLVIWDHTLQNTSQFFANYAWLTIVDGEIVFDMR